MHTKYYRDRSGRNFLGDWKVWKKMRDYVSKFIISDSFYKDRAGKNE